jgi:hypothetical protein
MMDKLMTKSTEDWDNVLKEGFSRNQVLIDLKLIPEDIKSKIINNYEEVKAAPRNKLLNYFIKHKLKNLMEVIEEF